MEKILWDDLLSLDNELIDSQHKQLFLLFEKLRASVQSCDLNFAASKCVTELVKYIDTHFSEEEELMLRLGYPDIEKHKLLHKKFVQEVEGYVSSCSFGDIPYAEMLEFLVKWLTGHIMVEDRKYASAGAVG